MARVRGGNTGYAVALVIFGFGFVVALLFAIIFYTKIEAHKIAEEDAKKDMAKYITAGQTAEASEYGGEGKTSTAGMLAKIKLQEEQIEKKDKDNAELAATIAELNVGYTKAVEDTTAEKANTKAESLQHTKLMSERDDSIKALMNDKSNLVSQISNLQDKLNRAMENADAVAQERIAELSKQVEEKAAEIVVVEDQLAGAIIKRDEAIRALPKTLPDNTTLPDGAVASVINNTNNLFINRGRQNGLVMGMTFEVYDPDPIIRLDDLGAARGKATIEVYKLEDDIATCRVVRLSRGEQIETGDPIVNLAYDPNMDISIYPFGYFDIERDGGNNDLARIQGLIKQGGATIPDLTLGEDGIPVLTPDLDYIVLGAKPDYPDDPGDSFDPEVVKIYQAKLAEYKAYFRILDDAKVMRIPVLSQNRLLPLLGYYTR